LTALLQEVQRLLEQLEVSVKGVISDGEETIGSAVAFVFASGPTSTLPVSFSQRCHQAFL